MVPAKLIAALAPGGPVLNLGSHAYDTPPARGVRTTAGRYGLVVDGFQHGGIMDPPVGRTTVVWGSTTTPPTYAPGPATVSGALGSVDVVEGQDAWVRLPGGDLWFVNSNGVHLTLQGCPPVTASVLPG